VWDGVTISLYVNGELHGQKEATKRPSSSSTFYVGFGELRPWFKGSLDEVAYYDKALTPNRILEHFLADPPPPNDRPVVTEPEDPATPVDPETPVSNDPPVTAPAKPAGTKPSGGAGAKDIPAESGPKATKPKVSPTAGASKKKCKKFKKNKAKYKRCLKKNRKK
jgi:hypothetical protein